MIVSLLGSISNDRRPLFSTRELAREYLLEMPPSERAALFAKRPEKSAVRAELADVFGLKGSDGARP